MPSIKLDFGLSIESPPTLGTVILRPAETTYVNQEVQSGKIAYAQNVSVSTDKYGNSVALPGPYAGTFSPTLTTGPIYTKAFDSENQKLWFNYDQTNILDCIKNIDTGSLPALDTTQTVTLTIAGKSPIVSDISNSTEYQNSPGSLYVYATLIDTSGSTWVKAFQSNSVTSVAVGLSTTTVGGLLPILKTQFDGNLYIGNAHKIDRVNPTNSSLSSGTTLSAVGTSADGAVPPDWFITALGEWNGKLLAAVSNSAPPTSTPGSIFSERNGSGQSRIYFWDIANNPTGNFLNTFVNSPSHYISVLHTDLSGNLFAFGGVDEGRTTIYQWNGYGFDSIFSYIGDMPRNRHSVTFDSIGRLIWMTCNGQLCRYNVKTDIFEHLNTLGAGSFGGIVGVLQGAVGEDFIHSEAASAISATIGIVSLRQFTGDGGGADSSATPLMISGLQNVPQKSIITNVIVSLQKALINTEKLEVRLYGQNYPATAYTVLGTLDFANDGAIASKQVRSLAYNNDLMSLGIAWKATASSTTAPGVISAEIQYKQISTL